METSSRFNAASLFSVPGLVAVITGGGSGLGAIAAHALCANGARAVFILGRREGSLLETKKNSPDPDAIHPVVCDITRKESLSAAVDHIRAEVGYINLLFANSGTNKSTLMSGYDSVEELQQQLWEPEMSIFSDTLNLNIIGTYYTVVAFLGLLDEGNKRGAVPEKSQVVFTSSAASFSRKVAIGVAYCVSKSAITHMMKQLSSTLAPYQIRVNAIAPGFFLTELTQSLPVMRGEKDPREEGAVKSDFIPLQRVGRDEDFAGVVLFLASKAGAFLDGAHILTDGGRMSVMPSTY